jgi:protein TonB
MRLLFSLLLVVSLLQAQGGGVGRGGPAPPGSFPELIQKTNPEYTKEALDAKLEGSVMLSGMIGTDGVPSDIRVIRGLGKGLDEKAVECFQKWRFTPAIRDGDPFPVSTEVLITFRLPAPESK